MPFIHRDNSVKKSLISASDDPHLPLIAAKGERYRDYRNQWVQTMNFELVTEMPTQIDFELNPSCNMKCPMCTWSAIETYGGGRKNWMDFDLYKKIIDSASSGVLSVNLNRVNEPLIRHDLPQFVSYAVEKGIPEVMFNTNGMLLSEDMSCRLIDAGLTKLSVSLDAMTPETYDQIRIGGNYEKVITNIDNFLRIRKEKGSSVPLLKITFLILSINKHEKDDFLEHWTRKADLISLQHALNPFSGDLREERSKSLGLPNDENKAGVGNAEIEYFVDSTMRCAQPFQRLAIQPNGDVLPCCNFYGTDLKVGDFNNQSVYEVWNGKAMKHLRKIHKSGNYQENEICKKCINSQVSDSPDF